MRAYITVLIGNGLYQERKNGIRFEVRAPMLNTGHTPAHKVRYVARAAVLPVPLPFGFDFTLNEPATGAATLNAQQQFVLTRVVDDFVNDGDVERIKYAHLHAVYFWGRIEYEDVFGETHFTQFAHFLRWNPDGTIVGHYCEGHNNAS